MESLRIRIPSMKPSFERICPTSSVSSIFSLSTISSQRDSCEGSLRLNRESARLMYEDIAKLNPFYEVYENFWNTESEESSLTFSSRGSSDSARSPSLTSITSSQDSFRPLEVSSSPSIRHFRSHLDLHETKRHQVFLHEGSEHLPTYGEYDGQSSQFAALDYTDSVKQQQPLSPIEKPEDDSDSDELEPDLRPKVHPSKYPHKKLFGQDGWLGCSTDVHALPLEKRTSTMFKDIGKKIKKQVGEIADDMAKAYPNRFSSAALCRSKSSLNLAARVSLDPATQSKLYSDLEVMICLSANDFLVQQHGEGRLSAESIKKINSFWGSKNRPQVVEFHFDQATQHRLINDNLRTLRFNGECSTNPIRLVTNMNNWKALAKDMSVRTFCVPDSVIRKHLYDIHEILDMLDAPRETFLDFEELQVRTLSLIKDQSYRSGSDNSTLSDSRTSKTSSIRCSEDSRRVYPTKW